MRNLRWIPLVALLAALPLFLGFGGGKDGLSEVEKIVKLVRIIYEGGSHPESAIVMAELAIFDLGKKGKIEDAPGELEKVLPQVKKPALRNFTRFLLVAAYGEQKKAPAKAVEHLQALISENAPNVKDDGPPPILPPGKHEAK